MENKKIKIHEFVLSPYPRRLWVMKGGDYTKLNKFYCWPDGTEIADSYFNVNNKAALTSDLFADKKTDYLGFVVWCTGKVKNRDIAHEAGHVILYLFQDLDIKIDADNQEPFTYMLGDIYEKIESVVRNKKMPNIE